MREVLLDQLGVIERVEIHAWAADLLTGVAPTPDRLGRRARHAVEAAALSANRARAAVAACRATAASMGNTFGYEQAEALLAEAVAVHERAGLPEPQTPVLVEWAEALLRCGRLTEARRVFERAATQADAADVVLLARAALGLSGVRLNEHRTRLEWQRVAGMQRRALAHLPAAEELLRHRLAVRRPPARCAERPPVEAVPGASTGRRPGSH